MLCVLVPGEVLPPFFTPSFLVMWGWTVRGKARGIFPRKLIRLVSGLLKKSKFMENARSSKRGITIPDDNLK